MSRTSSVVPPWRARRTRAVLAGIGLVLCGVAVVACGGDGTVYEAANAIMDLGAQDRVRLGTIELERLEAEVAVGVLRDAQRLSERSGRSAMPSSEQVESAIKKLGKT